MIDAEHRRLLGAFVRARREALRPETPGTRRRTPGLRREELAARAGIGLTWVAWIEQGREVRPSAETLARLATALCLTRAERDYLFELAARRDPAAAAGNPAPAAPEAVRAVVLALAWPAYGLDPGWNVVCRNEAAARLFVGLGEEAEGNLLRWAFTHPAARRLLPDWDDRAARLLAEFRADFSRHLSDPAERAVVDQLSAESEWFRACWERQAVAGREGGLRRFRHPEDGEMDFRQHTLRADERSDFKVVVLEPEMKRPRKA
jgi:transcriptional regulator with XRE-family HTH domain